VSTRSAVLVAHAVNAESDCADRLRAPRKADIMASNQPDFFMNPKAQVIVYMSAAVVLYDAVSSIVSKQLGISYTSFVVGSYVLYGISGFLGARRANIVFAAKVGAIVGFVDATIGWAVSLAIGPVLPATGPVTVAGWAFIAAFVVLTAAIVGLAGGAIARSRSGSSPSTS
jgi:hypothetical protein